MTLLLYNAFGYAFAFITARDMMKAEMKHSIAHGEYPGLKLHLAFKLSEVESGAAGLKFIHSKEFTWRGGMYDIISSEIIGDSIRYYCINDTKEKNLIHGFVGKESGDESSPLGKLLKNVRVELPLAFPALKDNFPSGEIQFPEFFYRVITRSIEPPQRPPARH